MLKWVDCTIFFLLTIFISFSFFQTAVWVIIVVILLVIVVGAVWFIYKKFNKENKTADNNPVGYEVVKGSDGKVYSDTTAEV